MSSVTGRLTAGSAHAVAGKPIIAAALATPIAAIREVFISPFPHFSCGLCARVWIFSLLGGVRDALCAAGLQPCPAIHQTPGGGVHARRTALSDRPIGGRTSSPGKSARGVMTEHFLARLFAASMR